MDERYFVHEIRRHLGETIQSMAPPEEALRLTIIVIAELLTDLVGFAPQMAVPVNAALLPAGWRLVPVR